MNAQELHGNLRNITQLTESSEALWHRLHADYEAATGTVLCDILPEELTKGIAIKLDELLTDMREVVRQASMRVVQETIQERRRERGE